MIKGNNSDVMAEGTAQSSHSILCIGLTVVDLITTVERFPEEDSDQRGLSFRKQRGGNASNTCTVLSLLNSSCEYLGVLPSQSDPEHRWLREDFDGHGISIKGCVYSDRPCPIATVLVSQQNGSRTIVFCDNGHPELSYRQFMDGVGDRLLDFSWIHFELNLNMDNYVRMLETINEKRKVQHHSSQPVEDPRPSAIPTISVEVEKPHLLYPERAMKLADVVFISKDWARSWGWTDMHTAARHASQLCRPHTTVVCPWAEAGAAACHDGNIFTAAAIAPGPVVDTLGAGDTFVAGFLHARNRQKTIQQALHYACHVAAYKCTIEGYEGLSKFAQSDLSDI